LVPEADQGSQSPSRHKYGGYAKADKKLSASWSSASHKLIWDVLCYPPFIIGYPSFGHLFRGKTCNHCRGTSRHIDFNAKGRILLRNDLTGSARVRMFFRHAINMVSGCANANTVQGGGAALST
jgi:hypothetical protein